MPKCTKCGKKFSTLQALNDHFKTVHPGERFVAPKATSASRNFVVVIVIVIIVMGSLVGFLIYSQLNQKTTTPPVDTSLIGQTISSGLYQNLSGVSSATLNAVGSGGSGVTPPTKVTGAPLTNNGKPEFLYVGAEYCPYCAAQRWSMIVALSKFGTFSNLEYMLSSSTDVYANTPTFTFVNATYTSQYISFVSVEQENRSQQPLQTLSQAQSALMSQYDTGSSIPFLDIGNSSGNYYTVVGSQYYPYQLRVGQSSGGAPYNWTQIGAHLDNSSSVFAKNIDGAANTLISAICSVDGQQPSSVCGQQFAKLPLMILPGNFGSQPILSVPTASSSSKLEPSI